MTIAPRDLATLDPNEVQQAVSQATASIVEANPNLDLRRGPLFDLLVYLHGQLSTQIGDNIADYLNARSLAAIATDPTLSDPSLVDDVLSNYQLTRLPGTQAAGEVTIIVNDSTTVTIGVGAIFSANGQQFTADQTFTAKSNPAQINSTSDRLLIPIANGQYAFTITVTAVSAGAAGQLAQNTTIIPSSLPSGYVTSYTASDFTGGTDPETNQALLDRLQQGAAARDLSNRTTMNALLRATPATSAFIVSSIVGYGDPEMLRDKHSIFPVAMGGRADWYVRSQLTLNNSVVAVGATLIIKNDDGSGTWQINLPRDTAAGVYEIVTIVPAGTVPGTMLGSFPITSDVRALDLTGGGFIPDLATTIEGTFSRYQTIVLQFIDTVTSVDNLALGTVQNYDLTLASMPLVDVIQDMIAARGIRHFGADCLVKAPMPCFTRISLTVFKQSGMADPDLAAMQTAIANAVNSTAFTGQLYGSMIYESVAAYLQPPMAVSRLDMLGRLKYPDLSVRWLRSPEVLIVPNDYANMVSPKTVQFYTSPADIAITTATTIPTEN